MICIIISYIFLYVVQNIGRSSEMSYEIVTECSCMYVLLIMLSIREVKFSSVFNHEGV